MDLRISLPNGNCIEHSNASLARSFYEARACGNLEAVRTKLAEEVAWHA